MVKFINTEFNPYINTIIRKSEKIQNINLARALKFIHGINSKEDAEVFYQSAGLNLILEIILNEIGEKNLDAVFFEFSALSSTLENDILFSSLCIYQNKYKNTIITKNFSTIFNNIIQSLFKFRYALYYQADFFIHPDKARAYLSLLPDFLNNVSYKSEIDSYKELLNNYYSFIDVEDYSKLLKSKYEKTPLIKLDNENVGVQCIPITGINYSKVKEISKNFGERQNVLPFHLLLHQLYNNHILVKSKNNENVRRTYFISIPFLGAPFSNEKHKYNGQGGCFIYLIPDLNYEIHHEIFNKLAEEISYLAKDITYNYLFETGVHLAFASKNNALKSALAAIMSRNGSHNIGSHILSSVSNNYNELPDDQILYKYIQDRMDYIAQITTEFPAWSYPVWFVRDLIRNFYIQYHLLNYIARSEGLNAFHYQEAKEQHDSIVIKIRRAGKEDFIIAPHSNNTSFDDDIAIAVPGGVVGNQAFYTILENIIRNSAKHNWAGQSQSEQEAFKSLEIIIEIDEKSERDFVIFRVWDNITNIFNDEQITEGDSRLKRLPIEGGNEKVITDNVTPCYLHHAMNSKLSQSFIDQSTGQLLKANWGLAEMKISAGFLNKKDTSVIGSNEIQDILFDYTDQGYSGIISAVPMREKIEGNGVTGGESYRYHLGYQFAIPKPKEVLIYGQLPDIANKDEYRKHSIYFQEGDSEKNIDYEFVVLIDDGTNEFVNRIKRYLINPDDNKDELYLDIKGEIERFPVRLFIVSDKLAQQLQQDDILSVNSEIQFLTKRIVPLPETLFKEKLTNNQQDFKLFLYARWIEHLKKMQGIADKQLKMILNVEGNNRHNNKQKVYRLLFDKFKTEILNDSQCEQDVKSELDAIDILTLDEYDGERRERKQPAPYDSIESLIDKWIDLAIYEFERDKTTNRLIFNQEVNDFNVRPRVSDELRDKIDGWAEHLKDIAQSYYKIIQKIYIRYEEETPTLPPIYRADKSINTKIRFENAISDLVKVTITDDTYDEGYDIAYDRHTLMKKKLCSEALSGSQTYFSILNHLPNDDYLKQKIGLQLVENALLRMIVIDERVAQYLNQFKYTIKERYDGANIEIPLRVKTLEGESPWIDLIQNLAKDVAAFDLENIEADKFDVMIIHQGILDKVMKNSSKEKFSTLLKNIKEKIPFVIITSGRGEPENIPDDAKFLAFSNIETFLLKDYPEKFLLSQIAMKITSIKRQ